MKEGDLNTKYFHSRGSHRLTFNSISKLLNTIGEWISDNAGMWKLALEHSRDIFQASRGNWNIQWDSHMDFIKESLSEEALRILNEPFTPLEIKEA